VFSAKSTLRINYTKKTKNTGHLAVKFKQSFTSRFALICSVILPVLSWRGRCATEIFRFNSILSTLRSASVVVVPARPCSRTFKASASAHSNIGFSNMNRTADITRDGEGGPPSTCGRASAVAITMYSPQTVTNCPKLPQTRYAVFDAATLSDFWITTQSWWSRYVFRLSR